MIALSHLRREQRHDLSPLDRACLGIAAQAARKEPCRACAVEAFEDLVQLRLGGQESQVTTMVDGAPLEELALARQYDALLRARGHPDARQRRSSGVTSKASNFGWTAMRSPSPSARSTPTDSPFACTSRLRYAARRAPRSCDWRWPRAQRHSNSCPPALGRGIDSAVRRNGGSRWSSHRVSQCAARRRSNVPVNGPDQR